MQGTYLSKAKILCMEYMDHVVSTYYTYQYCHILSHTYCHMYLAIHMKALQKVPEKMELYLL